MNKYNLFKISKELFYIKLNFNSQFFSTPLQRWHKNFLLTVVSNHLIYYSTPINLTYSWSFGSLAGLCLVVQILTGCFLAMFYTPHVELAFASIEFIMRDVKYGWFMRYAHSNGASMFFFVVYCHIFRGLYYGSYAKPREWLWISGVLLLLLMMATAFLGYVLPWGQMSFWGATVITSMFSVIPKVGQSIVEWLWGGFTVNNPTLNRFFTFHFLLPFVIAAVAFLHLILLHKEGSSAPITDSTGVDHVTFYSYFFVKDLFAFFCFLFIFSTFLFYYPNQLGDPNNYILADSIHTPRHIVPEWYFLPFYAMLRSIPHKAAGIIAMFFSLMILFLIPFLNTSIIKDSNSRIFFKICYFAVLADFLVLGWLGQSPVKDCYIFAGQVATFYYFFFFLVLLPLSGLLETVSIYYKATVMLSSDIWRLIFKIIWMIPKIYKKFGGFSAFLITLSKTVSINYKATAMFYDSSWRVFLKIIYMIPNTYRRFGGFSVFFITLSTCAYAIDVSLCVCVIIYCIDGALHVLSTTFAFTGSVSPELVSHFNGMDLGNETINYQKESPTTTKPVLRYIYYIGLDIIKNYIVIYKNPVGIDDYFGVLLVYLFTFWWRHIRIKIVKIIQKVIMVF